MKRLVHSLQETRRPQRWVACGIWLVCTSVAGAVELSHAMRVELLSEGLRSFDRGVSLRHSDPVEAAATFQNAAAKLQLIVDSGVRNGKLYYNLGNAYLEGGRLGQAILNYRKALVLIPGDARAEANLVYARTLCEDQIPPTSQRAFLTTLFYWHYATALRSRYILFMVFYVLFWLLMAIRTFVGRFRWRYVLVPCLILWLILGSSAAVDLFVQSQTREGVITAEEVVARKGNGLGFEPQFKQKLHEGVEFVVVEQRQGWLHIELPDGKTGWVQLREAGLI